MAVTKAGFVRKLMLMRHPRIFAMGCLALVLTAGLWVAHAADAKTALHPDFAGVWEQPFDPAVLRAPPKPGANPPPYRPEFMQIYQRKVALVTNGQIDLGGQCSPPGMPLIATSIGRFEILDAPAGRLTILYEYQSQIRRLYLDQAHSSHLDPTMNGESIAHWEGRSLVVDTQGISQFAYLDAVEGPHSDALQVTERFSLKEPDNLRVDYTVTDPVELTQPWTYSRNFHRVPNGRLIDYECNENPRNPTRADGSLGFTFEQTRH